MIKLITAHWEKFLGCILLLLCATLLGSFTLYRYSGQTRLAGGTLYESLHTNESDSVAVTNDNTKATSTQEIKELNERYFRPSNTPALNTTIDFGSIYGKETPVYPTPEKLLLAYYGILREASNSFNYNIGCGTIGETGLPYPYAYQLLTSNYKKRMNEKQFKDSFMGISHINLLKIKKAYSPENTPTDTSYYMTEFEVITSRKINEKTQKEAQGLFGYYYALITVKNLGKAGFKIGAMQVVPENYCCAPYHSWFYDAELVVPIVYQNNLKLVKDIESPKKINDMITINASKGNNMYRFEFVRLTNGYDLLLHQFELRDNNWIEVNLLKGSGFESLAFTIENYNR